MLHSVLLHSSALRRIWYDATTRTLIAELGDGSALRHLDVPPAVFEELLAAPSHGEHYFAHVHDAYPADEVPLVGAYGNRSEFTPHQEPPARN